MAKKGKGLKKGKQIQHRRTTSVMKVTDKT
jgi:hypothetical protein